MARKSYTLEYKAKLVIQVLRGEKELNEIAAEQGINPNMLRRWQTEFLANASRAFDETRQAKEARRKEEALKNPLSPTCYETSPFSCQIKCGPLISPTSKCDMAICT